MSGETVLDAPLAVTAVFSFQPSADTTNTPKLALEMLTRCTGCCCETVCVLIWVPKDDPSDFMTL